MSAPYCKVPHALSPLPWRSAGLRLVFLALLLLVATFDVEAGVASGPTVSVDVSPVLEAVRGTLRYEVDGLTCGVLKVERFLAHRVAVARRLAWLSAIRIRSSSPFRALLGRGIVVSHFDFGAGERSRRIALTLDDGPTENTPRTLEILARHHVHATFFLVGNHAAHHEALVRMIAESGHEIENHTWSHELGRPYTSLCFTTSSLAHQLSEIRRTDADLAIPTRFLRAPGGLFERRGETLEAARETGKVVVNWDVDGDTPGWQHLAGGRIIGEEPSDVLRHYEDRVRNGSIVLMHPENRNDAPYTLEILDAFITDMQRDGYKFVTLNELLTVPTAVARR